MASSLLRNGVPLAGAFFMAPSFLVMAVFTQALLKPFSSQKAAVMDKLLYSGYMSYVTLLYEYVSGTQVIFHGPDDIREYAEDEAVLYMSNHQCTMDWVVAEMVAGRQSVDALSRTQFIMKSEVSLLPCYGLYLFLHGCAFVRRRWHHDESALRKAVQWYYDTGSSPWIILYPEGTRFDPLAHEKIALSQEHCIKQNVTPFQDVLAPRVRGFRTLAQELHTMYGTKAVIYDVTIAYRAKGLKTRPYSPSMLIFMGGTHPRIDLRIERISLDSVPLDSVEDARRWLFDLFESKDQWLQQVYNGELDDQMPQSTNIPYSSLAGIAALSTATLGACLAPYALLGLRRASQLALLTSILSVGCARIVAW